MYTYIFIHICTYIYIHMYTYVYVFVQIDIYVYIYMHIDSYICIILHTRMYRYTYIYICIYMCVYVYPLFTKPGTKHRQPELMKSVFRQLGPRAASSRSPDGLPGHPGWSPQKCQVTTQSPGRIQKKMEPPILDSNAPMV